MVNLLSYHLQQDIRQLHGSETECFVELKPIAFEK